MRIRKYDKETYFPYFCEAGSYQQTGIVWKNKIEALEGAVIKSPVIEITWEETGFFMTALFWCVLPWILGRLPLLLKDYPWGIIQRKDNKR